MKRRFSVLLAGYYGMNNLGDELLARSAIFRLLDCGLSSRRIALLSGDPAASRVNMGIEAFDRMSPVEIWHALRSSESLLLGGGGLFQDMTSIRSLVYYFLLVLTARIAGCRVWAVGQSIGPLKNSFSRFLTRCAFAFCKVVSVRDTHSYDFLNGRALLTDDLVLSLPVHSSHQKKDSHVVLFNIRPFDNNLEFRAARAFAEWKRDRNIEVVAVAFSPDDESLLNSSKIREILGNVCTVRVNTENFSDIFSHADYAFGMRLHFSVLCFLYNIPCTAVPYDPKVSGFAGRFGGKMWMEGKLDTPSTWREQDRLDEVKSCIQADFADCFAEVFC